MQEKPKIGRNWANVFLPRYKASDIIDVLAKEKEQFVKEGSVDMLSRNAINALREFGLRINLWESLATSGKISDALTNSPGVTSVFGHSLITTNQQAAELAMPDTMSSIFFVYGPNSKEAAATAVGTNILKRDEDVALATTGNILGKGNDVHIALMTKRQLRQDASPIPNILTININDFEKDVAGHPEYLKGATLSSLKKQYVAHRALLFLLKELGRPSDMPFIPRQTDERFLKYRTSLMKSVVNKLMTKNYKLGIAESATGGRLVDAITDVENGGLVLGKCTVLYNEKEKGDAGVPADTRTEDAVYSIPAAYELARTAMGNDQKHPDTQVQIGFTGLLDTKDTRNQRTSRHKPGTIFYSVLVKDKAAFSDIKRVPVKNRLEMKEFSLITVYWQTLQVLNDKFTSEPAF